MSFTLKNYIKRGLIDAVGKMADYQIILNSAGWMEKGVLSEDDLMEIQTAIDARYVVENPDIGMNAVEIDPAKSRLNQTNKR